MSSQTVYAQFLRRLLPLLGLAYALAVVLTTALYYQDQRIEAEKQRSQTLDTFASILIKPLWDCNSVTAHGIMQAMVLQPNVLGASAPDQCAQKIIAVGTLMDATNPNTLQAPLNYQDEGGRSHPLGVLIISFRPASIFAAISRGLVPQLAVFLTMLAAVLAGALWTFERTIGQPLMQLRAAMREHRELEPIPPGWTEELTEVSRTYNDQLRILQQQARHDPLTGLGNRLQLEEHLNRAIRRSQRTNSKGHLLLLDLNQFKPINDTHGHAAGDVVLRTVAQRLLHAVRSTDSVARLGGDEFVIVAPARGSAAGGDIQQFSARLRAALAEPIIWHDQVLRIGASIGTAEFPTDGTNSSTLLAMADANMYQEKAAKAAARER